MAIRACETQHRRAQSKQDCTSTLILTVLGRRTLLCCSCAEHASAPLNSPRVGLHLTWHSNPPPSFSSHHHLHKQQLTSVTSCWVTIASMSAEAIASTTSSALVVAGAPVDAPPSLPADAADDRRCLATASVMVCVGGAGHTREKAHSMGLTILCSVRSNTVCCEGLEPASYRRGSISWSPHPRQPRLAFVPQHPNTPCLLGGALHSPAVAASAAGFRGWQPGNHGPHAAILRTAAPRQPAGSQSDAAWTAREWSAKTHMRNTSKHICRKQR